MVHWKKEFDDLEAAVRDNGGLSVLGERDFAAHKRRGDFSGHVGDTLAILADIVQPHSFDELVQYGFQYFPRSTPPLRSSDRFSQGARDRGESLSLAAIVQ